MSAAVVFAHRNPTLWHTANRTAPYIPVRNIVKDTEVGFILSKLSRVFKLKNLRRLPSTTSNLVRSEVQKVLASGLIQLGFPWDFAPEPGPNWSPRKIDQTPLLLTWAIGWRRQLQFGVTLHKINKHEETYCIHLLCGKPHFWAIENHCTWAKI